MRTALGWVLVRRMRAKDDGDGPRAPALAGYSRTSWMRHRLGVVGESPWSGSAVSWEFRAGHPAQS